jgi:hypothetical protein
VLIVLSRARRWATTGKTYDIAERDIPMLWVGQRTVLIGFRVPDTKTPVFPVASRAVKRSRAAFISFMSLTTVFRPVWRADETNIRGIHFTDRLFGFLALVVKRMLFPFVSLASLFRSRPQAAAQSSAPRGHSFCEFLD